MKRKILLTLSFLFLGLWVLGLFYTNQTSIHIALIVSLLFYIRSLMTIRPPVIKTTGDTHQPQSATDDGMVSL